jgi:hypothetical protein
MHIKDKLINILKLHADLVRDYAQVQHDFMREKLMIKDQLKIELGRYEKKYNQTILQNLPSYYRLQELEGQLAEFWENLEPELEETLVKALSMCKNTNKILKFKLNLSLGKKLNANAIKTIVLELST